VDSRADPTTTTSPPLWDGYCADPFVLNTPDGYVMYGTAPGLLPDGRAFQTLHSHDLHTWHDTGGALTIEGDPPAGTEWWAPEVAHTDGTYYMYYSRGVSDTGHQLRVATATTPTGPFTDTGTVLTPHLPFAIDPSPFRDPHGTWWLYYATDLVDGHRPGTVLAVQRLATMTHLAGEPRIILRATAEWQRYQAHRHIYGATHDWHTLEGPAVLHTDHGYLLLYSGGNWQTPGYGVATATAPTPQGPWHENPDHPQILTSTSTGLTGPGHCSILTDDTGTHHLFLHAWDPTLNRRRPHHMTLHLHHDTITVHTPHPTPR
jgi:arabinan endo-1,5-alpha-L-arabinosidase